MSQNSTMSTAIRALSKTAEAENVSGIVNLLDSLLPNFNLANEILNPKTAFKTIRAFDKSNSFVCPEVPTCAGLIDMSFSCATGIENDVNVIEIEECDKPYTFSFKEDSTMAQDLPANGVFTDMSASVTATARKECMTISPIVRYTYYKTDGRMCIKSAPCGSLIDDLVGLTSKKQIKKFRQVILASANAVANTITTTTGDMLDKLQLAYNSLADLPSNQGKEVIGYVNAAVLRRLEQLRDNQARPLATDLYVCPVTGCRELCFGGMKLKSVESEFAPIIGTTTKTTDALFVVPKNIFAIKSETKIVELGWDKIMSSLENVVGSFQYNNAKIPSVFATSTAAKITLNV